MIEHFWNLKWCEVDMFDIWWKWKRKLVQSSTGIKINLGAMFTPCASPRPI